MIAIYVGNMGAGKTISMVREAKKYYDAGYTILSNMRLNFPYKSITSKDIINFAKNKEGLYNSVVLIDELHIFMDSRRALTGKNLMASYFVTQTRKLRVKLLGTTQHRHQIDKRVRDNTEVFIDCEIIELPAIYKENEKLKIVINHINTRTNYKKITFMANTYFNLYDTEETIFDDEEAEEIKTKQRLRPCKQNTKNGVKRKKK